MEQYFKKEKWRGGKLHFVTGRLAEHSLRQALERLSAQSSFSYTVDVLKITVAALMTPKWIASRINVPEGTDFVIVPGYCEGSLDPIDKVACCEVIRGPRDLRRLDVFFNQPNDRGEEYGARDIQILAEINHAPDLHLDDIVKYARKYSADGADVIDVGCNPGGTWSGVADAVKAIRDVGLDVSIDSMDVREVELAVRAGAELVLSVNETNREAAVDWGVEVVVVPDNPTTQDGLEQTVDYLAGQGVALRIDPVLSPIGFGFAQSIGNYLDIRKRYVDAEIMMGIGNLTELTDADSAGINVLLLGLCQELGIRSVLTTEVIPWAQTSVRECDIARKLVFHAVQNGVLPKHVEEKLIILRDADRPDYNALFFDKLSADIRDHNIRLFVDDAGIHLVTTGRHLVNSDPFLLFQEYLDGDDGRMDVGHAYYIGYEMCKAMTALTLGKNYQQDEPLNWGFLTSSEVSHCKIKDRRE